MNLPNRASLNYLLLQRCRPHKAACMSNLEAYLQFVDLVRLHRAKRLAREMKRPGEAQLYEMNGLSNESGGAAPIPRATG